VILAMNSSFILKIESLNNINALHAVSLAAKIEILYEQQGVTYNNCQHSLSENENNWLLAGSTKFCNNF
jgi:hypothetical protein